ncbi:MAG: hypothetical protein ACR2IQ_00450 [Minisyncoccia bacterium]
MNNLENNPYPARNPDIEENKKEKQDTTNTPSQIEPNKDDSFQHEAEEKKDVENSIEKGDFIPHYLLESAE